MELGLTYILKFSIYIPKIGEFWHIYNELAHSVTFLRRARGGHGLLKFFLTPLFAPLFARPPAIFCI